MQEILEGIYKQVDELYMDTSFAITDWAKGVARSEVTRRSRGVAHEETTNYSLGVELVGSSFSVAWFEVSFYKRGDKTFKHKKRVGIPKSKVYTAKQFSKAQEWELELILDIEKDLGRVRNAKEQLMKAHRSILHAASSANVSVKPVLMKDRIHKLNTSYKGVKGYKEEMIAKGIG